jgi:hypothetical protein
MRVSDRLIADRQARRANSESLAGPLAGLSDQEARQKHLSTLPGAASVKRNLLEFLIGIETDLLKFR